MNETEIWGGFAATSAEKSVGKRDFSNNNGRYSVGGNVAYNHAMSAHHNTTT